MEKEIRAMEALIGIEHEKIIINRYWNCYRCPKACVQSFYDKENIVFIEFCNIELHIEDLVFSTYITNYGPGDFCFSMKTGLDLSSFVHLYNKMEDEHLDFLQHQLPTFMNLVINTATKGSETSFFDKPFFNANDIVNEDICSWPIKYKILVGKPLGEYIMSHIIPMLCYAVKLMHELYSFTDIPCLTKNTLLSSDGCAQEQLVRKAYHLFQKYGYL